MTQKLNFIQAFRGLAAILVLLYHMDPILERNLNLNFLSGIFAFGFSGVDFFFVISGFIIFYVHHTNLGNPSKVQSFFAKRFIRIYPLYWLVLGAKLLASSRLNYQVDGNATDFLAVIKAFLLLPQDDGFSSGAFLGVSWTLTFEVFFYCVFALAILFNRKLFAGLASIWLSVCLLQFIGIIQLVNNNLYLEILLSPLNFEFAFGCLIAYLLIYREILYEKIILAVGLGLYTLCAIAYSYGLITTGYRAVTFGMCAALIIAGTVAIELRKSIPIPNVLLFLGDASYSIYLMHGFFINNLMKLIVKLFPTIGTNIIALNLSGLVVVGLTIGFGCLMHLWIEKPLLTAFRRYAVARA